MSSATTSCRALWSALAIPCCIVKQFIAIVQNPRTGKVIAEKVLDYFDDRIKQKVRSPAL